MMDPALMVIVISGISVIAYMKAIYAVWSKPPVRRFERKHRIAIAIITVTFMAILCVALALIAPFLIPWLTKAISMSLSLSGIKSYIIAFLEFYKEAFEIRILSSWR